LSGADVMYSTGDLPSMRASMRPGSNAAARVSTAVAGFQRTWPKYAATKAANAWR